MTPAQKAGEHLDFVAFDTHGHAGDRDLRAAALVYTHEILKEIQLLDHGEFHRILDQILGTIIDTCKNSKVKMP